MEESFGLYDFEVEDLQTPNNNVERLEAPSSGMFFETIEEARKYYEDYGRQNGFWIRTRTSSKGQNRSNDVTSVLFVCAKEGMYVRKAEKEGVKGNDEREEDDKVLPKKRKRSCSTAKCGCNAQLRIKRDKWSLKWEANKFRIIDSKELVHDDGKEESEALRLSHMCQESTKLACLAAPSNEAYTIYIETMNGLFEKLIKVTSCAPPMDACLEKDNVHTTDHSQILISDPNISQTKGRKKDATGKGVSVQFGRLKSGIEMALNKKKRKCNLCNKLGHDKRTCPENPMSKTYKDIHTVDVTQAEYTTEKGLHPILR
ncbi:hypothetical protein Acr_00g0041740 [Actinidia rufa]|uniref:FAR1 domain-containing protein n=1 Tax=Actinidia rufa TaxID=165716 RepID=A0A7J0DI37_9ERIC|nr:hypothetical protein Acr_00g0041740 [Actinidia rufa]